MQLTTNFHLEEFACKDGTLVPDEYLDNVRGLACNLQRLRDEIRRPIVINSAYRTESYNRMVGGAKNSQHLVAKAADIIVPGMRPENVSNIIRRLIGKRLLWEGGLGLYPRRFVHYDIRGTRARWVG